VWLFCVPQRRRGGFFHINSRCREKRWMIFALKSKNTYIYIQNTTSNPSSLTFIISHVSARAHVCRHPIQSLIP